MARPRFNVSRSIHSSLRSFLKEICALDLFDFATMPKPNCFVHYYHSGRGPANPPTLARIPCYLVAAFALGQEAGEQDTRFQFTHVGLVPFQFERRVVKVKRGRLRGQFRTVRIPLIRDPWPNPPGPLPEAIGYAPENFGPFITLTPGGLAVRYDIVLAERRFRGTAREYVRLYLRRAAGREEKS